MRRSAFLISTAAALAAACLPGVGRAQSSSLRPIRIVVPHPPGVGVDVLARVLVPDLSALLGQPVVVDNRPGVGTLLSMDVVAKAEPDGHTFGLGIPSSLAAHPRLYDRPLFEVEKALVPVSLVWTLGWCLYIQAEVPAQTLAEFIALARAKPEVLTYATTGVGSFQHLTTEWLAALAGIRLRHIPYGTGPWTADLLTGRVDAAMWALTGLQEHVRAGKLRLLAVSMGGPRAEAFPDVPTFAQAGLPGFEATAWTGMVAPQGTPLESIERMAAALATVVHRPAMRDSLARAGGVPAVGTPESFDAMLRAERVRWRRVIAEAGIRLE